MNDKNAYAYGLPRSRWSLGITGEWRFVSKNVVRGLESGRLFFSITKKAYGEFTGLKSFHTYM
ncbi:MAG: hypothetical protein LBF71_02005 [Campylobacteraceae bacterium]|nr:hypothetical protein [Campylobacteraceae bacterium]